MGRGSVELAGCAGAFARVEGFCLGPGPLWRRRGSQSSAPVRMSGFIRKGSHGNAPAAFWLRYSCMINPSNYIPPAWKT